MAIPSPGTSADSPPCNLSYTVLLNNGSTTSIPLQDMALLITSPPVDPSSVGDSSSSQDSLLPRINSKIMYNPTAKRHRVECNICGVSLAAGSLCSHMEMQHNTYRSFVLNRELTVAVVYQATTDATSTIFCPVPACVGVVSSKAALQSHFLQSHPQDRIAQRKGPFPYRNATDVDCRSRMQPRMANTTTLSCVRMGWQGRYSMQQPKART
jgi:hypothetical protein